MNCVLIAGGGAKGSLACVTACVRLFADRPPRGEEIVGAATEYGADLIVIGNTRGLIEKLMFGDVVQKVASAATVPVLLVR